MRKLILVLLALVAVNVVGPAPAWASTEWMRWGMDPYASSDVEAVRKLPDALLAMGVPEPVRARLLEAVRANPQGERTFLNPGDRFTAMMWSPSGDVRTDVIVGRHPVRHGVVESAEAREWRVEDQGQIYVLVLPDICNNWAWRSYQAPTPERVVVVPQLECAEIVVSDARPGDVLRVVVSANGPLPPSECWAYRDGSGSWVAWPGACTDCSWEFLSSYVPGRLTMPGRVTVASREVVLRIPVLVSQRDYVSLCIVRGERRSCTFTVEPSDFGGRREYSLPDWEWTGCPEEVRRRN